MSGIRSLLVGIANLILLALLIVAPVAAFLVAGTAMKQWGGGSFNTPAALSAGVAAFIMALPMAALLAVFLDIREQLVTINGRRRPMAFTPARAAATSPPMAAPAAVSPAPERFSAVSEMQSRFQKFHGKSISPEQAQELLTAQSQGWYLTKEKELKARL